MPHYLPAALAGLCLAAFVNHPAAAQSGGAPAAGRLYYEFTQRVDQQQVKVRMFDTNGQEMKLDAPGSTIELPTALSGQRSLIYRGNRAREEQARDVRMAGGNISVMPDKAAAAPPPKLPSVEETQYFDLAARTTVAVTTLDGASYQLPAQAVPAPPPGWRDLPQTRKIAGFQCHKVTVPFHKETYTLWVTTELPFAYSPVRELTPTRGVVLALSSDQEEYTATKLTAEPVTEATVQPSSQTQLVTEAELKELRAKNQADLHQRLLEHYSGASKQ